VELLIKTFELLFPDMAFLSFLVELETFLGDDANCGK
jgi:hypothetical protein